MNTCVYFQQINEYFGFIFHPSIIFAELLESELLRSWHFF